MLFLTHSVTLALQHLYSTQTLMILKDLHTLQKLSLLTASHLLHLPDLSSAVYESIHSSIGLDNINTLVNTSNTQGQLGPLKAAPRRTRRQNRTNQLTSSAGPEKSDIQLLHRQIMERHPELISVLFHKPKIKLILRPL